VLPLDPGQVSQRFTVVRDHPTGEPGPHRTPHLGPLVGIDDGAILADVIVIRLATKLHLKDRVPQLTQPVHHHAPVGASCVTEDRIGPVLLDNLRNLDRDRHGVGPPAAKRVARKRPDWETRRRPS
jgi:hypothetical protein